MPRFSANISTLFTEVPLLQRIALAAQYGFAGIEVQFPYKVPAAAFKAELDRAGLPLVLFNLPCGDFIHGGAGNAAVAGCEAEFDTALALACEYAEVLMPRCINVLSGRSSDAGRDAALNVFAANLAKATQALAGTGVQLVTEAINSVDQPGFLLSRSSEVVDLIAQLPAISFGLQYDIYHMEIMEQNAQLRNPAVFSQIKHFQFADSPGRHEPGSGKIDFVTLFEFIDASDYEGFVGAEYFPSTNTVDSLGWMEFFA